MAKGESAGDVKSIITRILRLKEEQDALAEDIREIYAEARSNGLDKTALGQVVSAIRKREKDPQKFQELADNAQLYLNAYDGTGTPVATRARAHEAAPARTAEFQQLSDVVASIAPATPPDNLEIPPFLRRTQSEARAS